MATNKQAFINSILPAAIQYGQKIGVDPRIIVAQAAHESAWGKSAPGNNYFGIKSHGQGGGQNLTTHEVINGQRVKVNDNFRTFNSPSDSVAGYADFLTSNKRYKPMLAAQGLDAQIDALGRSGYATDPNYADRIRSIAKSIPIGSQVASQEAAPPQASGTPAPAMGEPISIGASPVAQPSGGIMGAFSPSSVSPQQPDPSIGQAVSAFGSGDIAGGLGNVFGAMAAPRQTSQPAPVQPMQMAPIQGPTAQQAAALSNFLTNLTRRRTV